MLHWGTSHIPGNLRRQQPPRTPVSTEDEAALLDQRQQCANSASLSWAAGANVPYAAAQDCTAEQLSGMAQSPYKRCCSMISPNSSPSATNSRAVQAPKIAAASPSQPRPSAASPIRQPSSVAKAASPSGASQAPGTVKLASQSADETPSAPETRSISTLRSVCCGLLLLVLGMLFGVLVNEIQWVDLVEMDPVLEHLEQWLNDPHAGSEGGSAYCADGLLIEGPARTGRNTLIFLALLSWTFLGVAIVADVFMAGIEQITSTETTKTVVLPSGEMRRYTVSVWNPTVASLTLMALGSSSPEILLSIIEIVGSGFYAGELGPSTIVGSAAYNLMIISAVSITAVSDGGKRYIKELPVFYITGVASLLAYVWLIVILVYNTPDIVDVWEGVATFVMFPILVYVSYRADVGDGKPPVFADDDPEGAEAAAAIGYDKNGREISKNDVSRVLALKTIEKLSGEEQLSAVASMLLPPQSQAYYRKAGMKAALGRNALDSAGQLRADIMKQESSAVDARGECRVQWAQSWCVCREAQGRVTLTIVRHGDASQACSVYYDTKNGSATEGVDFQKAAGLVSFAPGVTLQTVSVKIFGDVAEERDEAFTVVLSKPQACQLGEATVCDVTIQDDYGPGELHFDSREIEVLESAQRASFKVVRTHGCEGTVACLWETRDGSSVTGLGYVAASGKLVFEEGVVEKMIEVELIDTGMYHRSDEFQVMLTSATGRVGEKAVRFVDDSVSRKRRASIFAVAHVHADSERVAKVDETVHLLDFSLQQKPVPELSASSYRAQLEEAVQLPDDGTVGSTVVWLLALPWKLVGASVPPPDYAGGWACFLVALALIGALTAIIGDLASHMGCCMGLSKFVTAITFVAMGTSLPDTFASRIAAETEPYADASIVNITGSNSVNVFFGLGLPWMAAAIYWASLGQEHDDTWRDRYSGEPWYSPGIAIGFAVPAGDLAYSVQVFLGVAVLGFATLIGRRLLLGAELGGPPVAKWLSAVFLVALWGVYIALSIAHEGE